MFTDFSARLMSLATSDVGTSPTDEILPPLSGSLLLQHLQGIFRESIFIIDPNASLKASPFSSNPQEAMQSTVQLLQMIDTLMKRMAASGTAKPIVALLSTHSIATTPVELANVPDIHWVSMVYLPAHYRLPDGTFIHHERGRWIWMDPLPGFSLPALLKDGLKKGIQAQAIDAERRPVQIQIPGHFADCQFLNAKDCRLQPETQVGASGYWALYTSMTLLITGQTDFLFAFKERMAMMAHRIARCFAAFPGLLLSPHKSAFYHSEALISVLLSQPLLINPSLETTELSAFSCVHPHLDVYVRIIDALSLEKLLDDTLTYVKLKNFQDIKPRRVMLGLPFKDGGLRLLIINYDNLDLTTLSILQNRLAMLGATATSDEIYPLVAQLYARIDSLLVGASDTLDIRNPLMDILSRLSRWSTLTIEPLTLTQADTIFANTLLTQRALKCLYDGFIAASTYDELKAEMPFCETPHLQALWKSAFLLAREFIQNTQPALAKELEKKYITLAKLMLLNRQMSVTDFEPLDLYRLQQLKTHHEQFKASIYQLDENVFSMLLKSCSVDVIKGWLRGFQQPAGLFQILDAQIQQQLEALHSFEERCETQIQLKNTWAGWLKYRSLQAKDLTLMSSMMLPIGQLFAGTAQYLKPLFIDVCAKMAYCQMGGSLEAANAIRQSAEIFFSEERLPAIATYSGYALGAVITLNSGLYSGLKLLTVTALTLAYRNYAQEKELLDETASVTKERSAILGPVGLYRILNLAFASAEAYYFQNPQHLITFLSGTTLSVVFAYGYEKCAPSPTIQREQLEHQNGLFVISIIGQITGQKVMGFIAYNYNRWQLCRHIETLLKNNFEKDEIRLISAECTEPSLTLKFWKEETIGVCVKIKAIEFESNDRLVKTFPCKISTYNSASFFSQHGSIECGEACVEKTPSRLLLLPAP